MKIKIISDIPNHSCKEMKLIPLQAFPQKIPHLNGNENFINVGFPISSLAWAYRTHEKNSCIEYLAVGLCTSDNSGEGDALSRITKKTFNLNHLHSSNSGRINASKGSGHILIYKVHFNNFANIFESVHLCSIFDYRKIIIF